MKPARAKIARPASDVPTAAAAVAVVVAAAAVVVDTAKVAREVGGTKKPC